MLTLITATAASASGGTTASARSAGISPSAEPGWPSEPSRLTGELVSRSLDKRRRSVVARESFKRNLKIDCKNGVLVDGMSGEHSICEELSSTIVGRMGCLRLRRNARHPRFVLSSTPTLSERPLSLSLFGGNSPAPSGATLRDFKLRRTFLHIVNYDNEVTHGNLKSTV